MDEWLELDQLFEELRAANADWAASAEAVQRQVESFRELSEQVERHFDELAVYEALLRLGRRVLNDAARIHVARLHFGLMRSAAIIWYPLDDPRPALASAPPQGQYRLEVRIGPGYLLGGRPEARLTGDQRLTVLIEGERQMVATLPITAEKYRAALLRAFQAPHYAGPSREEETAAAPEAGESSPNEPPAAEEQATSPEAATPSAEPAPGEQAPPPQDRPKRRRSRVARDAATEQPPTPVAGDEPIPMPAAHDRGE